MQQRLNLAPFGSGLVVLDRTQLPGSIPARGRHLPPESTHTRPSVQALKKGFACEIPGHCGLARYVTASCFSLATGGILRRHLLHNRHRALLVLDSTKFEINANSSHVVAKVGNIGAVGIAYDGVRFTVSSLTGLVRINNTTVTVGDRLPDCCVIAFGDNSARRFVTFDVSNPEVMP